METANLTPSIFENPEFGKVRVVMRESEPWFVAKDVCDCLGLDNVSQTVSYLDEDEKVALEANIISNDVGGRGTLLISEAGLYSLILRSRKPEAKAFKRWVTHEVLPSIRKNGSYLAGQPKTLPEALRAYADEIERRELAEKQRDYYKRTKAEIGSRREATAMQTASVQKRRADKLECEKNDLLVRIGDSTEWKTVKAMSKRLRKYFDLSKKGVYSIIGKKLKMISMGIGKGVGQVEDSTYGVINCYHINAWDIFFDNCERDRDFLGHMRCRDTEPLPVHN